MAPPFPTKKCGQSVKNTKWAAAELDPSPCASHRSREHQTKQITHTQAY